MSEYDRMHLERYADLFRKAGWLPPDSAARLRAVVRLEREADAIITASLVSADQSDWDRLDSIDEELAAAHAAITEADLGITTTTEATR